MTWVRPKLRDQTAKALLAKGQELDHWPAFRELVQALEAERGPVPSEPRAEAAPRWSVRDARARRPRKATPVGDVRLQVWQRSEGVCECGCRRRIRWETFEMDHFFGKARWPESPETCWALSKECHDDKHRADPTRLRWLYLFKAHLQAHGFGLSPTAEKVEGQIEGQELVERAQALKAGRKAQ